MLQNVWYRIIVCSVRGVDSGLVQSEERNSASYMLIVVLGVSKKFCVSLSHG